MPDSAFRLTWRSAPSPAKLLAPEIIRNLGKAYRANCVDDRMDLRHQNVDLTQLGDNVLLLAALSRHSDPPSPYPTTYFKVDQFNGGGSVQHTRLDSRDPHIALLSTLAFPAASGW